MAFRRPVKLDGGNLRNMTDAEILLLQQEAIRQYGLNPSTTLTYSNGGGNLANIPDYRLQASALAIAATPYPTPAGTSTVTVNNQHTVQARALSGSAFPYRDANSYANFSYPVYLDNGNVRAMTTNDFYDTIITPAKDYLITNEGTDDNLYRAGTYTIHTTNSLTGATLVDSNPIYTDTQADIAAFSSGSLPEFQDQPETVQEYFLHRFDPVAGVDFVPPVVHKIDTNDLQVMPSAQYSALAADQIRYNVDNGYDYSGGSTFTKYISYQYWPIAGTGAAALPGTTSDARGSSMTNNIASSATTRTGQDQPDPNATQYYAQSVPSGAQTSYTTWNLIVAYTDNGGTYQ